MWSQSHTSQKSHADAQEASLAELVSWPYCFMKLWFLLVKDQAILDQATAAFHEAGKSHA